MPEGFEQLLLEEMQEEDDDIIFDDFSFIDAFIDEDDEKVFEYDNEEEDSEDG